MKWLTLAITLIWHRVLNIRAKKLGILWVAIIVMSFPAYAKDQYLLVSSREGGDILRYNVNTGNFVDVFIPAQASGINVSYGMTLGPDGNLYVTTGSTETYPNEDPRVLKFDSNTGEYLGTFASNIEMRGPTDVAFGPDGNLYVSDGLASKVFRFDGKTGESLGVFATGNINDNFRGLAWGPDGNLYVGPLQGYIDKFDGATGASLGIFPTPPAGTMHNVTFGPDGLLYGSDYFGSSVYAYDIVTGELVKSFDGLNGALGMIFSDDGDLFVANYFNYEIIKFDINSGSSGTVFADASTLSGPVDFVLLPIPEPSTNAMLLAGLGLIGLIMYRRKQHT